MKISKLTQLISEEVERSLQFQELRSIHEIAESKLTEAEDYKYKKYVAKAFKDILGAQFDFRHAMGVKELTNKDMKLKKKADAIYNAIIDLQKDMKSKGLTEAMISSSGVKALRSGHKIKTQNGTYTITGFGSKTNATKDFEATNEKGKKFNLRVSLRGARGIQVAPAPSLNFPEKEEMLESIVNEALARGLKPLLIIGSKITKNIGEDALVKLSDKFDRIDDEYAGDIASHLDMAIELMQDGYPGDATKMLKQFNTKCKEVLKGKPIASVFESKLTEASKSNLKKGDKFKSTQTGEILFIIEPKGDGYDYRMSSDPRSKTHAPKAWFDMMIKTGKLVAESVLRGQLAGDSALDMADLLRRYGFKKILKQPNDSVTYLQLTDKGKGNKVVAMLKKMFGIKAQLVTFPFLLPKYHAVKFDNDQIAEGKLNEMEMNDPLLIAIRARKQEIAKAKAAPKVKKLTTTQYYKLMDLESDLIRKVKDAAKEFNQLDSDMNAEAGQKGADWSDADANRYGGELDKLQTKVEKLNADRRKVMTSITNYRMS
jgi:hypothetical protein